MRVLVVGSGGVGSAFVAIASRREAYEHITVADIDLDRASAAVDTAEGNADGDRIRAAQVDASDAGAVAGLARQDLPAPRAVGGLGDAAGAARLFEVGQGAQLLGAEVG
ncbi:MAG: saccharopine dehydrogenase NADP-binding domain-containing protein, partial [Ilumatobacteraceae bacterium]